MGPSITKGALGPQRADPSVWHQHMMPSERAASGVVKSPDPGARLPGSLPGSATF